MKSALIFTRFMRSSVCITALGLVLICLNVRAYSQSNSIEIVIIAPTGSSIYFDGLHVGNIDQNGIYKTDYFDDIPQNEKTQLRIENDNYRPYERTLLLNHGDSKVIEVSLNELNNPEYGISAIYLPFFASLIFLGILYLSARIVYDRKKSRINMSVSSKSVNKKNKNRGATASASKIGDKIKRIIKPEIEAEGVVKFDKYLIQQKIAEGGVAEIFSARNQRGNIVALKVMSQYLEDEDMVNKFIGEGWAMQKIKTRFPDVPIANVFEYGREEADPNGVPYIAMELVEGKTLRFYIENNVLSIDQKINIIKQLTIALDASHRCNVMHRDLSPDNVLVKDSSEVEIRLIDFGVAKHEIHWLKGTSVGAAFGKPEYMAPEQIEGKQIDFRVDYYSLGILAFALFTGRAPFTGKMMYDVFDKHLKSDVPEMSNNVPKNIQDMIYSLLQKNPDQRPRSSEKILEYLNNT